MKRADFNYSPPWNSKSRTMNRYQMRVRPLTAEVRLACPGCKYLSLILPSLRRHGRNTDLARFHRSEGDVCFRGRKVPCRIDPQRCRVRVRSQMIARGLQGECLGIRRSPKYTWLSRKAEYVKEGNHTAAPLPCRPEISTTDSRKVVPRRLSRSSAPVVTSCFS